MKKGFDKKKIQFFKCENFGHFASECWSGKGKQTKNDEEQAKIAQDDSDSDTLLLMVTTTTNESCNSESWFLDTGCSNHMIINKYWLREIDPGRNTKVRLDDHRMLVAEGMRKIAIDERNEKLAIIEDVLYVIGLQFNLLSVGQHVQKGYLVTMKDNV